jgi:hypothetical protein
MNKNLNKASLNFVKGDQLKLLIRSNRAYFWLLGYGS